MINHYGVIGLGFQKILKDFFLYKIVFWYSFRILKMYKYVL